MHQQACAELAFLLLLGSLDDEPLRKLECNDPPLRSGGVVIRRRRCLQVHGRNAKNRRKLAAKAGFRDRLSPRGPSVQASDQD
jgi:hypothetical protein